MMRDADDAKKLIEAEGSQALSIPCDLAEGEETCKRIVDQARGAAGGRGAASPARAGGVPAQGLCAAGAALRLGAAHCVCRERMQHGGLPWACRFL